MTLDAIITASYSRLSATRDEFGSGRSRTGPHRHSRSHHFWPAGSPSKLRVTIVHDTRQRRHAHAACESDPSSPSSRFFRGSYSPGPSQCSWSVTTTYDSVSEVRSSGSKRTPRLLTPSLSVYKLKLNLNVTLEQQLHIAFIARPWQLATGFPWLPALLPRGPHLVVQLGARRLREHEDASEEPPRKGG